MGTDIHIHMEYRSRKTKRYQYGGKLRGERLYCIFEVMSEGIGEEPLFTARGLPGDVTKATYKDYKEWGCDGHHASWLTTVEFAACIVEAYYRMNSFEALQDYKEHEEFKERLKQDRSGRTRNTSCSKRRKKHEEEQTSRRNSTRKIKLRCYYLL